MDPTSNQQGQSAPPWAQPQQSSAPPWAPQPEAQPQAQPDASAPPWVQQQPSTPPWVQQQAQAQPGPYPQPQPYPQQEPYPQQPQQQVTPGYGSYGRANDDEENSSKKMGLFIGLGLVVVVAIALVAIIQATRPPFIPAPVSFTSYNARDGAFSCDQPAGWDMVDSAGGSVESGVRFTAGRAKIDVDSDLAGSLMGDITRAQNSQMENIGSMAGVNLPPPPPPVEKIHAMGKQRMMDKYNNYNEMPTLKFMSKGFGEGRVSEFTADGGPLTGKLHGFRATLLSTDRRITAVTVCPETNWTTLQPAFKRIITSIGAGQAQ